MKKAIIARKIGMTQYFGEDGTMVPVTVLEAGPCLVVQKKTVEKDGYAALQVGFGEMRPKHASKPLKGHYEARLGNDAPNPNRVLKELRLDDTAQFDVGAEIKADFFTVGDCVDVSGVSLGKGYQGTVKRHGTGRGPKSHGSKYHRGPGAMSAATSPGRVPKGKRLPGQMGAKNVTVQNLQVVRVDADKNLLLVKGSVPGVRGAVVMVKDTVKAKA
jgi:large subunit ribosomal protein L3